MATTTLAEMVASLKFKSQVQSSENFDDPEALELLVTEAGEKHNSTYVISGTSCTVPANEKEAIVLLAWIELTFIRAQKFATESQSGGGGFSTDRNTPYYKLMDLAKKLDGRYKEVCTTLGLQTFYGSGGITSSEVTVESLDLSAQTPLETSLPPTAAVLTASPAAQANGDGTVVLSWTFKDNGNFAFYAICHIEGNESLIQDWNFESESGIPRIHDSANVTKITRMDQKSAKVLELTVSSGTKNRFVIAVGSKSGKYSYSNEIVLTQP
jgi:hypothetical protein